MGVLLKGTLFFSFQSLRISQDGNSQHDLQPFHRHRYVDSKETLIVVIDSQQIVLNRICHLHHLQLFLPLCEVRPCAPLLLI